MADVNAVQEEGEPGKRQCLTDGEIPRVDVFGKGILFWSIPNVGDDVSLEAEGDPPGEATNVYTERRIEHVVALLEEPCRTEGVILNELEPGKRITSTFGSDLVVIHLRVDPGVVDVQDQAVERPREIPEVRLPVDLDASQVCGINVVEERRHETLRTQIGESFVWPHARNPVYPWGLVEISTDDRLLQDHVLEPFDEPADGKEANFVVVEGEVRVVVL